MTKKKVLLTGIDPKLIDSSLANTTGWDASRVQATAQDAIKRLMDLGYEVQTCLVDYGETAESVVSDTLSREKFDCIMIGAGTRIIPQHTLLFEIFSLDEAAKALDYQKEGHPRGKLVLTI
jgi:hypothetical protein